MKTNQPPSPSGRSALTRWLVAMLAVGAMVAIGWRWMLGDIAANNSTAPPAATQSAASDTALTDGLASEGEIQVASQVAWDVVDDPSRDGWSTEVRSQQIQRVLEQIGNRFFLGELLTDESAARICAADFRGTRLIPAQLRRIFDDGLIQVDRATIANEFDDASPKTFPHRGIDGFRAMASEHSRAWSLKADKRCEFKIFRVQQRGNRFETRQYVAVSGRDDEMCVESHSTWISHWVLSPEANEFRLLSLELTEFDRTTLVSGERLFSDCTSAVLGSNESYHKQFLYGMNHWLDRNQDMRYFSPLGNPGLAVGDVNGDGLDDLYVCQEANLPNRLFLQQPDGTARDVSAEWHVDWLESSRSALLVDLDNDGDQDLAVALLGGVLIASNEGDRFEIREFLSTHDDTTSLSAADYDLDGDLDIYVCVDYPNDVIGTSDPQATVQVGAASRVYHDANTAGRNSLFRNDRSPASPWKFIDVTAESGLEANNRRFSWAAAWEDYDNDGDQDLYVANDFGRNNLYANSGGRFVDVARVAAAEDSASGMSVAWADVDRDRYMDLYISNMFSSAGSRISHQPAFKQDASQEVRTRLRRFARGSTLLRNSGAGSFEDISVAAGVTLGRWAWSSNFLDINNDGWQDIAVANGYITSEDSSDL